MSEQDALQFRIMLLKRRQEIFEHVSRLEAGWQTLGERDIELEEEAQKVDISSLYELLDERGKQEIEEIDLALCRMAVGTYGICEECEQLIPLKRLEALPESRLCRNCAQKYEQKQKKLRRAREVTPCTPLPEEYQNLSDEELQEEILEHLRADGRIDLEELKVTCRRGIVYLEGAIPSEGEHQIGLQILTDVLGLASIIDLLRIEELSWEREDRALGKAMPGLGREQPFGVEVEDITEDTLKSEEKGIPYSPPDRPVPERE